MIKKTFFALAMGSLMLTYAQEAANNSAQEANNDADVQEEVQNVKAGEALTAKFEDGLMEQLEQIKSDAGLDGEKYFSAVQVSQIGIKPSDRRYVAARQAAFNRAFSSAINTIVGSIQQEMTNAVEHGMISDSNGLKKADIDPKAANMINEAIKKELIAQGVDLKNPAAIKAAMPKVANCETLKQTTKSLAQLYISGIVVHKTIAKGDEIGILAYYSPAMNKFAQSLVAKKSMGKLPKGVNVNKLLRGINPAELSNTFGTRFYINEKGVPCIVSFGQAIIIGNQNAAAMTARRYADSYIQDFVGSSVAVSEMLDNSSSLANLQDSLGNTSATADVSERSKQLAKRASTKLTYNGIRQVLSRTVKLPSGHRMMVIARMWSPTSQSYATQAVASSRKGQALRDASNKKQVAPRKRGAKKQVARPAAPKKVQRQNAFQDESNDAEGSAGFVL